MALKDSFFGKLFGNSPEKPEPEPEPEVIPVEKQEAPKQTAPVVPPMTDLARLDLPPEHALHRLWTLRTEQAGWGPSPQLMLALPRGSQEPEPLTPAEVEKELPRLRLAVTTTANQRISKALPKKEDDPPPEMDALPVFFLPRDQLTAWMLIYPPVGAGRELNEDILWRALDAAQVRFGLDEALLAEIPKRKDKYFHLFLVARGTPPVHGRDGGIVDLFHREIQREVVVDEFDQVDYTSLNLVQNVEEGEAICRILPSLDGTPGTTVSGQPVPARDGKPASVPKGRNTEISEDGSKLIATRAGHVEFSGRTFQVKPVLEIGGDVDFSTGSINFLGDIHIAGDITSGFSVRAMGNVMVDGLVEAATVEAGGDLVVAKGVVGNGQAMLVGQRSIFAKYLENCSIYARENLQADCIINCEVYSDGVVQVRSGRGTIIGGRIRAAQEVSASIIGAKSECLTAIDLGGMPCEDFERERLLQEIRELNDKYERTELQPDSPARSSRLSSLRMKQSVAKMKLEQFDKDMETVASTPVREEESGRRMSCGLVYPGTVLTIGDASLRVDFETRQCVAMLIDGEINLM